MCTQHLNCYGLGTLTIRMQFIPIITDKKLQINTDVYKSWLIRFSVQIYSFVFCYVQFTYFIYFHLLRFAKRHLNLHNDNPLYLKMALLTALNFVRLVIIYWFFRKIAANLKRLNWLFSHLLIEKTGIRRPFSAKFPENKKPVL